MYRDMSLPESDSIEYQNVLFNQFLEVIPATSKPLIDQAQSVRYKVYCVENPYENPDQFPEGREWDEYDRRSDHILIRYRDVDMPIGTIRLVLRDPANPAAAFPIERNFEQLFDRKAVRSFGAIPPHRTAEVSRFAVTREFRRQLMACYKRIRDQEGNAELERAAKKLIDAPALMSRHITIGLIAMLFARSFQHQITHWYALITPSLWRYLAQLGIAFRPIGPLVHHHGWRRPMMARVDELFEEVAHKQPGLWLLADSFTRGFAGSERRVSVA